MIFNFVEPHTLRTHSEDREDEDGEIPSSPSSSLNSGGFSLVSGSPAAKSTTVCLQNDKITFSFSAFEPHLKTQF